MPRTKGSKNLKEPQKAINVYIPKWAYEAVKKKNKSKYVRNLIIKDLEENQ